MKWIVGTMLVLVAIASAADADKAVTFSTIVASDLTAMMYSIDAAGIVTLVINAKVRGTNGASYTARYKIVLTGAQKSTQASFISTNFLAGFNTQEGL